VALATKDEGKLKLMKWWKTWSRWI
jgi:hypothetical protein